MTTLTIAKTYEATFRLKSIPAGVKAEISEKVTADFDAYTKICPPEYLQDRIDNRNKIIDHKVSQAEWIWTYDRETHHTLTADNKAEATKMARAMAKELGLQFVYVYYQPNKKEA